MSTTKEHNMTYEIGDIITYRPFGGGTRTIKVNEKSDDIKNGRPGFAGTTANGCGYWGYDDQIVLGAR